MWFSNFNLKRFACLLLCFTYFRWLFCLTGYKSWALPIDHRAEIAWLCSHIQAQLPFTILLTKDATLWMHLIYYIIQIQKICEHHEQAPSSHILFVTVSVQPFKSKILLIQTCRKRNCKLTATWCPTVKLNVKEIRCLLISFTNEIVFERVDIGVS